MDAMAQAHAMGLLGQFNDDLTRVFDDTFGTHWAEIEDMLAIAAIVFDSAVTTRRLSEISGRDRRAISRMILRLRSEGLVATRQSDADKRVVEVVLTGRGKRKADRLRISIAEFFRASTDIAHEISHGLGSDDAPAVPAISADPIELLMRVCQAGVALVNVMPGAATQGRLAARQRAALVQIAMQGTVRPADLSPSLAVSSAGVAYIVDQLCAKGYVARRRGAVPEDRRAVVLEATAEGMKAVRAVMDGIDVQRESLSRLFAEIAHWRHTELNADLSPLSANQER
jgi:DNA-binding MarR family transcriptional regulator